MAEDRELAASVFEVDKPKDPSLDPTMLEPLRWLQYHGYIAEGAQLSREDLTEALKVAQNFSGIPATGEYDEVTRAMMSSQRCGNPDFDCPVVGPHAHGPLKFGLNGVVRERSPNLTYGIHDYSAHFTKQQCRDVIRDALFRWSAISPFTFTEADGDGYVDILYRWGTGIKPTTHFGCPSPFNDGTNAHAVKPMNATSQTRYDDPSCAGQIHFQDDFAKDWTLERMTHIAMHETGHALGLTHSYSQGATMASSANLDLSLDDISGIQAIYAPLNPQRPSLLGAADTLYQLLPNNGLIYQRLAPPRNGWTIIDNNPRNDQIVNSFGTVYLHHNTDWQVYRYGGKPWAWECIYDPEHVGDDNPTRMIAASGVSLYVLPEGPGSTMVLQWTGKPNKWIPLPFDPFAPYTSPKSREPFIRCITASGYDKSPRLFVMLKNGTVLCVQTPVTPSNDMSITVTPIWQPTSPNTTPQEDRALPVQMVFTSANSYSGTWTQASNNFYILFSNGTIHHLTSIEKPADPKSWKTVDESPLNSEIASAGEFLYFRRRDGTLWEYLGYTAPDDPDDVTTTHPLVMRVDEGVGNLSVAGLESTGGQGRRVFVVKSWGRVWERLT